MSDEISERFRMLKEFKEKLLLLRIPAVDLKVFGVVRINVHVTCISERTARQWATVLRKILPDARISIHETSWEAKRNKGTCLLPTMRHGWFVGAL